ncbi:MAG: CoA transferase, partial [Rhodospirillaceae bacterium]
MTYATPYAGLKIVDISQGFAGPYCASLFALYGAQVDKVEPFDGDWIRGIGRAIGDQTALSLVANPHKRSIALNLKSEAAQDVVKKMAADADVFLESFRPGVVERLGVGYDAIRAVNPKIVYASVSGFGQGGPYAKRPGSDTVLQSFTGLVSVNVGNDGVPHRVGMLVPDTVTGLYAHQAIAAALAGRVDEAEGVHLDISLAQAMGAFLAPKVIERQLEGGEPRILNAPAGTYETADGYVGMALVREREYGRICHAMKL